MNKGKCPSNYYPDIPIFLISIPLINAINYYLTYSNITFNWFLVITFSIDTIIGYVAWIAVRKIILSLDRVLPFGKSLTKRLIVQFISTTFTGLIIISILTEFVSLLATGKMAPLHFYTKDLFIIGIWFFVVNGIYVGMHYYNQWHKSEEIRNQENRQLAEGFIVKLGLKDLRLEFDQLKGFYIEEEAVICVDTDDIKYIVDLSLNEVEKRLPHQFFFRLNRKYIVQRAIVSGFRRAENGKIVVLLHQNKHFPPEVPVSRTKAPAFKGWFRPV